MPKELVEAKKHEGKLEVFCDSRMVAKKIGHKHKDVVSVIKNVIKDVEVIDKQRVKRLTNKGPSHRPLHKSTTPKYYTEEKEYRGQKYTAYYMNKRFFVRLMMQFKTKKALEWQERYFDQFDAMERYIINSEREKNEGWIAKRNESKQIRRAETDIIKKFTEYAISQGNKNARHYYKHYTNVVYKALGFISHKQPKLRDSLEYHEASELTLAERLVRIRLEEYMDDGMNYKDIYKTVREDLVNYCEALKIMDVKPREKLSTAL